MPSRFIASITSVSVQVISPCHFFHRPEMYHGSGAVVCIVCDVLCCTQALSAVAEELCLTCDVATMDQNASKNACSDVLPCACNLLILKPGFHYPSWRPELTARVDGWPVSITRQHGPCWRARVSTSRVDGPSTRVEETGLNTHIRNYM